MKSPLIRIFLCVYLCFSLFFPPSSYSQVVVDRNGGSANVIHVNGVDVVNINAPSASGISHNRFTEYNVPNNGLIINNSNLRNYDPNSKSQLNGSHVEFNLNFKSGERARVILNEVTGNNRSVMHGTTEIYGQQADLIIANPNGISCVGCGFINVDKLSMIAGSPRVINGVIQDYKLMPMGIVEVDGLGGRFNVNTVNSAVLVADMVRLAGEIRVYGDLSVLTGNSVYNPASNAVSSVDSGTRPQIAVDAYALGAMQAGTIRIYASQTGLGINVENGYLASAKGLQITADGNIKLRDVSAGESVKIQSTSGAVEQVSGGLIASNQQVAINGNSIALRGDVESIGDMQLTANGDISVNDLAVNGNIKLESATGAINQASGGLITGAQAAQLTGDTLLLLGDISSAGAMQLTANSDITVNNLASNSTIALQSTSSTIEQLVYGLITGNQPVTLTGNKISLLGDVESASSLQLTANNGIRINNLAANEAITLTSSAGTIEHLSNGLILGNQTVTLSGNANLAGEINAHDTVSIFGGDVSMSGKLGSDTDINISGNALTFNGAVQANRDVSVSGSKIDLLGGYFASSKLTLEAENSINTSESDLLADTIGIISWNGSITTGDISTGLLDVTAMQGDITFQGNNIIADTIKATGNNINNRAILLSANSEIIARNNLNNYGQFVTNSTSGKGVYSAQYINNYGSFKSAGDMEFHAGWDQINYEQASILAGGDLFFSTGRDFVNYRSEIYAGGNIAFTGIEGFLASNGSSLYIKGGKESIGAYVSRYKNPYANSVPEFVELPDVPIPTDSETLDEFDAYFQIADTEDKLFFGDISFGEDAQPGDSFSVGGYTVYIGKEVVKTGPKGPYTEFEIDEEDESSFFTIKKGGTTVAFEIRSDGEAIGEDIDSGDNTPPPAPAKNTGSKGSPELKANEKPYGYAFQAKGDASNSLLNIAGTIESGGDMLINTSFLKNIGVDKSNHANGQTLYDTAYHNTGASGGWYNWQLAGYNYITRTYLDTDGALISAGGNMNISAVELYNFGSTVSARGRLDIASAHVINETSKRTADVGAQFKERGYRGWTRVMGKRIGYGSKTDTKWQPRVENYYSARSALILGGYVKVSANKITNDQSENVANALMVRDQVINTNHDGVFIVPAGRNGLFKVVDDPRWLVQGDYMVLDPSEYLGGDYFFAQLQKPSDSQYMLTKPSEHLGGEYYFTGSGYGEIESGLDNPYKLLGDPAYETKLVMQQIREQTQQNYIENEGQISSDYEQMKQLYDNALVESKDLGLKVGVAITDEQIAQLKSSIIWYEPMDVNGETVLVPKLYVASAEDAFKPSSGSSVIAGNTVDIEAGELNNSGIIYGTDSVTIAAETVTNDSKLNQQAVIASGGTTVIEAETVHNKSGYIGGENTLISADEIINETKKYTQDLSLNADLVDKKEFAGFTAEIAADNMLQIEGDSLHSIGGKLSSKGDALIDVGEATFEALVLSSLYVKNTESDEFGGSTKTSEEIRTTTNVGSMIDVAGSLQLTTEGDALFKGSNVNAGNALFDIGGNLNIENVYDSYSRSYSETSSSMGGLEGSVDISQSIKQTVIGSQFNVNGDLVLISGGDTTIIGSELASEEGDVDIYTGYALTDDGSLEKSGTGGSLLEYEAFDYEYDYEYHESTSFMDGLKNMALAMLAPAVVLINDDVKVGFEGGKFNASMTLGEKTADSIETISNIAVGSVIQAGNSVSIVSDGDVNIQGSELSAGGDINVSATDNINITAAKNTTTTTETHESTTITATATVGNAYLDAGLAAMALIEAGKAVDAAKDALDEMEQLYSDGKATKEALDGAIANLAMATANLAQATIAAAQAAAGAATASSSSFGTGMYASAGVAMDTNSSTSTSTSTTYTGSTVGADGDISFTAGGSMLQAGSGVGSAGDITYNINDDLRFEAVRNSNIFTQDSKSASVSVSVGNNSVSGSASASSSSNKSQDSWYTNATTNAGGTISYDVGDDMVGIGYNAVGKQIEADIKGGLILTSLQNEGTSSNKSANIGVSAGSGSVGGNLGMSKGSGDYKQTNMSSLIGTESVDINVDGKLSLTGSAIANAELDDNGTIVKDLGNLNLSAGSFEYEDLTDYSENSQTGFSASTSISQGQDKETKATYTSGSTTIGATSTGSETEGITRATIGNGTVTIKDDSAIDYLNRDVTLMQETTKELTTGALDGSMTVDNRWFSDNGTDAILKDFKNFGKNLGQIKNGLRDNIISQVVYNSLFNDNVSAKDVFNAYLGVDEGVGEIQKDEELTKLANGLAKLSPEELDAVLEKMAEYLNENGESVDLSIYSNGRDGEKGYAHHEDGADSYNVGVNVNADGGGVDIADDDKTLNLLGHETSRLGESGHDEAYADVRGNLTEKIWGLKNYGNENTNYDTNGNKITGADWFNANQSSSNIFAGNSRKDYAVINNWLNPDSTSLSYEVRVEAKDIEDLPSWLPNAVRPRHTYTVLIPDNPEDFTAEALAANGLDPALAGHFVMLNDGRLAMTLGGYGDDPANGLSAGVGTALGFGNNLILDINRNTDINNVFEYDNGQEPMLLISRNVERQIVTSDLSDTQFIYNILSNASNYQNNMEDGTIDVQYNGFIRNCNNLTTSLITLSGGKFSHTDFSGLDIGFGTQLSNGFQTDDFLFMNNLKLSPVQYNMPVYNELKIPTIYLYPFW